MESHIGCVVLALLPGNIISSTHEKMSMPQLPAAFATGCCQQWLWANCAVTPPSWEHSTLAMLICKLINQHQRRFVSLIVQMRITLFIGAYLDSVMALVVGMIIFQVLCKQTWVVRFVQKFLHYSNCQMTKGSCWRCFVCNRWTVFEPRCEAHFGSSFSHLLANCFEVRGFVWILEAWCMSLSPTMSHWKSAMKANISNKFFKPLPGVNGKPPRLSKTPGATTCFHICRRIRKPWEIAKRLCIVLW